MDRTRGGINGGAIRNNRPRSTQGLLQGLHQEIFQTTRSRQGMHVACIDSMLCMQVGASRLFDPQIYATNYERSLSDRKESSLRNFAGSGDILTHREQTDEDTTARKDDAVDVEFEKEQAAEAEEAHWS